ncbi:Uracil permease 4 [Colletotrichum chlorophyti]|uniref:Uracil permease 4 n=1 Tax=Colletotrichum chlorophyti TaxID=708187 RepID=A0A1Q8S9D5_9PEZI|nr:Uracil permease 4 [Colletotrichum chlorophyti]
MISSSMIVNGLSWWQSWLCVWLGYAIAGAFVCLTGRIGAQYHIGFPVVNRSSFGIWGSLWPVFNRAAMACIWYGVQAYIGGHCVYLMIRSIWKSWDRNTISPGAFADQEGTSTADWVSFFIFWLCSLPAIWFPVHKIRHLFTVKSYVVPCAGIAFLIWAVVRAGGVGPIVRQPAKAQGSELAWEFVKGVMSAIANFATLIVNDPDFSRFARKPRDALWSQLLTIPIGFAFTSFIGIIVSSSSTVIYGEEIWDPLDLLEKFIDDGGSAQRFGVFVIAASFALAQLGTNIAANSVSAGTDMTALLPRYLSIRRGGYICAMVGLAMCPYTLLTSSNQFTTYLSSYSVFLSSIAGVMCSDYYLVRKGYLEIKELYDARKTGPYYFTYGIHWRGYVAYVAGILINVVGFAGAIGRDVPVGATYIYNLNFFCGFIIAGGVYWLLCKISPVPATSDKWMEVGDEIDDVRVATIDLYRVEMRLINTQTLGLETFNAESAPPYAILSHTWDDGNEVSFQEWTAAGSKPSVELRDKSGYLKIINACDKARDDGFGYLWVDTNCIDKTSSAELSEAVNSMFAWYERAAVCIIYLADVEWQEGLSEKIHAHEDPSFRSSRWFTRGWTLQELLAPQKAFFYTADWVEIGTKAELRFPISKITGIDVTYLAENRKIWSASLAARMSWASSRQTTRPEDMAYCLLGIFDINMPLIYGEGPKAFTRLQEEIIKASDDQTIFCWTWDPDKTHDEWQSILAPSPAVFSKSSAFVATYRNSESTPYEVTNVGLRIKLPVVAAVDCLCVMLSVISTDDSDPEHKRMICLPLTEEGHIHRRCPFPGSPFPVHRLMASEVKELYLLCRIPRHADGLVPWPYRHRFEYGFYVTMIDESFSTDMDRKLVTSIDCVVPQYMQTPSSHVSKPVYSAVGFRSALTHAFGGLILRINHLDGRFLVLLSVSKRGERHQWSCEVLDEKYAGHDVHAWLEEFKDPMEGKGVQPSSSAL